MHLGSMSLYITEGMIQQGRHDPARAFRFYVTNHHGSHDLARKEKLAIKTLCAVSVTYFFSTLLHGCQKHYLTFSYAKHTVPQVEAWECTLWILYMFYDG